MTQIFGVMFVFLIFEKKMQATRQFNVQSYKYAVEDDQLKADCKFWK